MRSRDHQPSPGFTYCQKQEEKKRKRTYLASDLRPATFKELAHTRPGPPFTRDFEFCWSLFINKLGELEE